MSNLVYVTFTLGDCTLHQLHTPLGKVSDYLSTDALCIFMFQARGQQKKRWKCCCSMLTLLMLPQTSAFARSAATGGN